MKPSRLEIEAGIGDAWLRMRSAASSLSDAAVGLDYPWLAPADAGDTSSRCARAYQLLLGLQRSGQIFSVQTGLKLYQNMICTSLSAEQDKDTALILYLHASLREVLIFSTETVTYPPRKPGKPKRQAAKKQSGGEKQAEQQANAKQAESVLYQQIPEEAKKALEANKSIGETIGSLLGIGS